MATQKGRQPASAKRPAARRTTNTSAKKNTTAASRKKAAARRRQPTSNPGIGIALLAAGVLLMLAILLPSNASVVKFFREGINGLFGFLSPVAAIWVGVLGLQVAFGDRWPVRHIVWIEVGVMLLCISTLVQLFNLEEILREMSLMEGQSYFGFIGRSFDRAKHLRSGAGAFGALLAYPLGMSIDLLGSVLLMFIALFATGFFAVRTAFPSSGERLNDWFGQIREDWDERKAERQEARENAQHMSRNPANEALLVDLPSELLEDEEDVAPPPRKVAKGRKQQRPVPVVEEPYEQMEIDWDAPPEPERRPAPAPRPAKQRPATRLYIENNRTAPAPQPQWTEERESPFTEYDAEKFKYATRPSRKDTQAIPDFIVKRREQLDEEYGRPEGLGTVRDEPEMEERPPTWFEEPQGGDTGIEEDDWPMPASFEDLIGVTAEPETPGVVEPPKSAARKVVPLQDIRDMQPKLDPATRLDRPDWQPEEPEPVIEAAPKPEEEYRQPPFSLLERDEQRARVDTRDADAAGASKLEETLASFGVSAKVNNVVHGPAITRYELQPAPGVKVSRIVNLMDDIALNMAALGLRIEAPIPGKAAIGIELANEKRETVYLREVLESPESLRHKSKLAVALGKDVAGKRIIVDLAEMPHLLIAGTTGSGKSVCINSLILSIIYRARPEEVRLILIDPKKVELTGYNGIPHLLVPVVTDAKKASGALAWAVLEMEERYNLFAEMQVRDIHEYNRRRDPETPLMSQIVIIIDELHDLMMVAAKEVEESICRIAQLARACGIHLVVATQRPSVNVITGVIKGNIPSRIAFKVPSQVDARTIMDGSGAEKLLGKGDMLVATSAEKSQRVQGCFVSSEEVNRVVEFVKNRHTTDYSQAVLDALDTIPETKAEAGGGDPAANDDETDEMFDKAVELVLESGQASISMLQRRLRIGYARAGRIVDIMTQRGIISQADGAKPREVLITRADYEDMRG